MTISYTKTRQGDYELSAFVKDAYGEYLLTRRYIGYTKAECTKLFKHEMKKAGN